MTPAYKETDWKPAQPADDLPRGEWWEIFGDPDLDALEEQVDVANQNLKIAEARLREARAAVGFNRAALFPTIRLASASASIRESGNQPFRSPGASTGSSGDLLLSLDMSYEVDVWGRVRRTVAAARREAQATAADLETARLSLHAELAIDYFELRGLDAEQQLLDNDGRRPSSAALRLTTQPLPAAARRRRPTSPRPRRSSRPRGRRRSTSTVAARALEHAIATLVGKPPAAFGLPRAPLDAPPPDIPAGLPVRAARAAPRHRGRRAPRRRGQRARSASPSAAYFPTFMLNASVGFESTLVREPPERARACCGRRERRSRRRSSTAGAAAPRRMPRTPPTTRPWPATARPPCTRLPAGRGQPGRAAHARGGGPAAAARRRSAQLSLPLATNRYRGGVDNYLEVITAQTVALTNQRTEIDILRRRIDASVLLVKALGGGWDVAELPAP